MRGVRRNPLIAACAALAVAVPAVGGVVARAAPDEPEEGVVLYRTDESELIEGLRVEACTEDGSEPGTIRLTAQVLTPEETPAELCAVTDVPPLPTRRERPASRWVDDRGQVIVGELRPEEMTRLQLATCIQQGTINSYSIHVPGQQPPSGCNLTSLNIPTTVGR